ncbi:hypothetical protein OSW16_17280 [Pseudomonas putida]|uniref:hypothetical protein n=1 Tax=Pseudomonas putida TaxID=303 RepID=UPI00226E8444|nr:hypothetical protein [Pseudomonas putida]WAB96303.1 hypothetical protein OSW16_17280 [Pseudomonas putida]
MKVNKDHLDRIKELATSGRKAWLAGNLELAEHDFLASWDAIPEPKLEYDFSQTASYGITIFYRSTGQIEKAKLWLNIARSSYGAGEASEEYISFLEGTILFENNELERAYELFYPQYKKYGKRAFEGEDKRYLHFVTERTKES